VDTGTALKGHPDLFGEYFATVIPGGDSMFAALDTAVWSGAASSCVPKGVHAGIPLQGCLRINTENVGSTVKYPAVYLTGGHARGQTLSVAFAGQGQH
jgi:Fe-S cluster assembly scaffold protein SufB